MWLLDDVIIFISIFMSHEHVQLYFWILNDEALQISNKQWMFPIFCLLFWSAKIAKILKSHHIDAKQKITFQHNSSKSENWNEWTNW